MFSLVLFSVDDSRIPEMVSAGIDIVIVDWEHRGKDGRQSGTDTEINRHTVEDLRRVRACTRARLLCRVNAFGEWTRGEVEDAVEAGADEIMLPMVRTPREVEATLDLADGRARVGILVETVAAVAGARALASLPLSRVYVGLNDLAIERGSANLFEAVVDGTVERVRERFDVPFGFGGLTLPDRGAPVPCRLLVAEMARLGCSFSFLRRSFWRDIEGLNPRVEVPRIRTALAAAAGRTPGEVERDRLELARTVRSTAAGPLRTFA
jgi:hypothetical protein